MLQNIGAIKSYHWANNVQDIANAVLTTGPVVMGTVWYNSMFDPTPEDNYFLRVDEASGIAGGHAWVIDGYNTKTDVFRMKNSWSYHWADGGFAHVTRADLEKLFSHDGEAAIGLEP